MPPLERRPLGNTGLDVTVVGLGGAGIGGEYGRVKEPAAVWTTRKAVALGINLIDVSPAYGDSEALVGKALTQNERNRVVLSTKLAFAAEEPWEIEAEMEASIRQSLERLRVDRIDILGLHRYVFETPRGVWAISSHAVLRPGGYLDCMRKWQEKGVVRALSFTALGDHAGVKALIDSGGFDCCEMEYSVLHRNTILEGVSHGDESLLTMARARGLGVLGIRPLAGGALANRATGSRGDAHTMRDRQKATVLQQRLGDRPLIEASLTFALMNKDLSSVLVGCRQPEEVEAAVQASRAAPPSEDVLALVDAFHQQANI